MGSRKGVESTMNERIFEHRPRLGISNIFNDAQLDANSHPRLRKELAEIYEQNDPPDFIMEFLQCLSSCLVILDKYPSVERALNFASVFLAQHYQDMEDLLVAVFEFIFTNHSCKTQAVRYRCCELMNRLLHSMDDQAGLYDDIFEKIASTMLERLQDKLPSIRAQAVMALQRLQNPQDPTCPIIKAFLFHMERDPSYDVRAKVVKHIAVTPRTLPVLFERTSDVNVTVKKEAYKALSRLRAVKLTIKQRQKICAAGVSDKSETVKSFVLNNLVLTWFKQCDLDYISFLKMIYVETMNEDDLEKIMFHLFKKQPSSTLIETLSNLLSKEKLIPVHQLTPENVTLWLLVVKYFSSAADDDLDKDLVGNVIPELTKFSKYLKDYGMNLKKNNLVNECIVIQLFKIAATYSFDDEKGREEMRKMCINYMMDENVGKIPIASIAKVFALIVPSVKERLVMMAEVISDIREPLQPSDSQPLDEVAQVQQQLAQVSCDSLDSDRVLSVDSETLVKCLTIIIEFLKAKDVKEIDATLLSLKAHVIMECFTSPNAEVQALAQDVMAFYCIWNLDIAKENFLKFCFQVSNTNDTICISAVRSLTDILLIYGFHPFSLQNDASAAAVIRSKGSLSCDDLSSDPTLTPSQVFLVSLLIDLLSHEIPAVRALACQGLAKLMISGHLSSPLVLARLVLIWFSPASALQPEIRQPIGIFLNVFTSKRKEAGDVILNCIIPAVKAAREMSCQEDEEIDPLSVGKLLISLLRTDVCAPPSNMKTEGSYHLQLATRMCKELLIVNGCDPLVMGKMMAMIDLQPSDGSVCGNLLLLVCRGIKKMGKFWEKKVLKTMQGLKTKLEDMKEKSKEDNSLQGSVNLSANATTNSTLKPIAEENNSANLPDVSASYSAQLPADEIDDSGVLASESPKEPTAASRENMIVDETMNSLLDVSAHAVSNTSLPPSQNDEESGDCKRRASRKKGSIAVVDGNAATGRGGVIPESDDEEESERDAVDQREISTAVGNTASLTGDVISESDGETSGTDSEVIAAKPLRLRNIISDSDNDSASDEEAVSARSSSASSVTRTTNNRGNRLLKRSNRHAIKDFVSKDAFSPRKTRSTAKKGLR